MKKYFQTYEEYSSLTASWIFNIQFRITRIINKFKYDLIIDYNFYKLDWLGLGWF